MLVVQTARFYFGALKTFNWKTNVIFLMTKCWVSFKQESEPFSLHPWRLFAVKVRQESPLELGSPVLVESMVYFTQIPSLATELKLWVDYTVSLPKLFPSLFDYVCKSYQSTGSLGYIALISFSPSRYQPPIPVYLQSLVESNTVVEQVCLSRMFSFEPINIYDVSGSDVGFGT